MDTKLTIKNFRVFDEDGVSIDLKPITILTGCNSSGKSSIVKAVLLVNSFLKGQKKDIFGEFSLMALRNQKIDFSTYPNNLLGRFDKVVHNNSKRKRFSIEYTTYSYLLSQDVLVKLVFSKGKGDDLNNAYIDTFTLCIDNKPFLFYNRKKNNATANFNLIKERCLDFLPIEKAIDIYCSLFGKRYIENSITEKDFFSKSAELRSYINHFGEKRVEDVYQYVCRTNQEKTILDQTQISSDKIMEILNNGFPSQMSVIEKLKEIDKDKIWGYVKTECLKKDNEKEYVISKHIIDDFVRSKYKSFFDYFKHYEVAYLNEVNVYSYNVFYDSIYENLFGVCLDADLEKENIKSLESQWKKSNDETKFKFIYSASIWWDFKSEKKSYYYNKYNGLPHYYIFDWFEKYLKRIVEESFCPIWAGHVEYVGSSRAQIHRLYTLEQKDDFSELLKKYFEAKIAFEDWHFKYKKDSFLNKWIREFGIGKSISVVQDKEGLGVQIYVCKENGDKRLLADEGYGMTQIVSILLQIETTILSLEGIYANKTYGLNSFSSETYKNSLRPTTITIEEPEIHLHPKYQSLLADMFLEAYQKYNIHFIVETHSEYLIRKTQVLVAKMGFNSNVESDAKSPFRTFYVPQEGKPYSLGYRKDGKFAESFGSGFYDEATNLIFEIM